MSKKPFLQKDPVVPTPKQKRAKLGFELDHKAPTKAQFFKALGSQRIPLKQSAAYESLPVRLHAYLWVMCVDRLLAIDTRTRTPFEERARQNTLALSREMRAYLATLPRQSFRSELLSQEGFVLGKKSRKDLVCESVLRNISNIATYSKESLSVATRRILRKTCQHLANITFPQKQRPHSYSFEVEAQERWMVAYIGWCLDTLAWSGDRFYMGTLSESDLALPPELRLSSKSLTLPLFEQ